MSGTQAGGISAMTTNKRKYGADFPAMIGQVGGLWHGPKGFAVRRDVAVTAGKKGGQASKRGKAAAAKQTRICKYCGSAQHLTITCELRMRAVAARNVRNEEIELQRERLARIAAKWSRK